LTEPSSAAEQGHPAMDRAMKGTSAHPDRPVPPASPPKPVFSPLGSVQTAAEIQPKDSEAIGAPDASPGIASKGIDSAGIAEPVGPRSHAGRSETRKDISLPRSGSPQPNPSRVDASILRKSARKDAGATKPNSTPPPASTAVELSPSGGHQGKTSIQHTDVDPLQPSPTPSDWQGQERFGTPRLNTPSVPEAARPRSGHGGPAIALPTVADRPHSQKHGVRIAIGRIEVQVNNHPQPVAPGKSTAQPASREIDLESRFLGRFVLRPS
jgi:hypothetical protein